MPPREQTLASKIGEEQPLMSVPLTSDHSDEGPSAIEPQAPSFWQAIQQRRDCSDQEAASDAVQLARRQRNKWAAMGFGQVIALFAASVNMTSFTLENNFGVVAPTFQLFLMYIFLTFHLCFRSQVYRPSEQIYHMPLFRFRVRIPWYLYFLVSCIDVGAGIIMLLSLQYTSLTSITLLGSLTVPSTMLFSKILLGKAFQMHHIFGVILCVLGGCLTIWSDLDQQNDHDGTNVAEYPRPWGLNIGDLMATSAALLYGLGDAVSEYSIKHIDRMEFLGMLGFFGMILTGIQFPFQELDVLSALFHDPRANQGAFALMTSYVILLLLYYVTEASFLVSSDATLLNLSLQTQNLWAILFSVLANHAAPPMLFYLALLLVVIGVFVYEVGPSSDPLLQLAQAGRTEDPILVGTEDMADSQNESATDGVQQLPKSQRGHYSSIQQIEII